MLRPRCIVAVLAYVLVAPWVSAAPERPDAPSDVDIAEIGRPAIRVYTDLDGLPQNAITALTYDVRGFLWVGTKDGAAYYNGQQWTTMPLPASLGTNWVQSILVASDGTMWFGMRGGGLARYTGRDWVVYRAASGEIPDDEVFALLESRSESGLPEIYVGTSGGIAVFAFDRWTRLPAIDGPPEGNAIRTLMHARTPDGRDVIWAGTGEHGVARFADGAWTVWNTKNSRLPDNRVTQFVETAVLDGRPMLVVATYGGGLARFVDGDWVPYTGATAIPEPIVSCLRETRDVSGERILWAGTYSGTARFAKGRWSMLTSRLRLPVRGIWTLLDTMSTSGSRTLWLGMSGGGLARWEFGRWTAITKETGLPDNSIYSLMETKNRRNESVYWIGTNSGGVARYENGAWSVIDVESGAPSNSPLCMTVTPGPGGEDDVWLGSNNEGLTRMRGRAARTWTRQDGGLPHNRVLCLLASRTGDDRPCVFAGTSNGVARAVGDRVEPYDVGPLPSVNVQCLHETVAADGRRALWVGTGGGLVRAERGVSTVYTTEDGLPASSILCVQDVRAPDGTRELWVGTRGGGISRRPLDAADAAWQTISTGTRPALPNDTVYRVQQDAQGRVYAFTNKGIARLTPREPTDDDPAPYSAYVFTTEDGLPSNECNTGASMVDSRGRIWAGTIGGAAVFDPAGEIVDTTAKPLVIQRAVIAGTGRQIGPLAELEYDENYLTFEYALLSYFREGDTLYRTQLVGFDAAPSAWTRDAKKQYSSLPRGSYRFLVWGMDANGNVTGPVTIPFSVKPSPWQSWMAYLLYAVILAGIVYVAIRVRMASLRRSNRMLEAHIADRTAELASKVEALRVSEQRALDARNLALVSERRARESEQTALEASRAKSFFLANMSHELRTPLNAILGFVQLMERDVNVTPDQRRSLGVITRSGEHLLGLINNVLSLSKIEAGREALDVVTFDLRHLLLGLEEMLRLRADSKGLSLAFRIDPEVPRFARGDEAKLRQILINLLGNAVKFTVTGGVTLHASWSAKRAVFSVTDTGCGMTEEEAGTIFRAFVQTEAGMRSHEGTGLGLAISRDFALLMGGDITVESAVGLGSVFRVEIPLSAASDSDVPAAPRRAIAVAADGPVAHVLVVDDVAENRTVLERLLLALGLRVTSVTNGREAIAAWTSERPDIVLMDVRMPVMNGIDATREIRRLELEAAAEGADPSHTPIVALTASAFDHDRQKIFDAGCDDYIPKPFRDTVICEKLTEHTGIHFRYEQAEVVEFHSSAGPDISATSDALSAIPPNIRRDLSAAVTIGDAAAALGTIDGIRPSDPILAATLEDLVRRYRFDDILELMPSANAVRSSEAAD